MYAREVHQARGHTIFEISTWYLPEHDSMVARYPTESTPPHMLHSPEEGHEFGPTLLVPTLW
jgi:hypothetical protein